MSALVLESRYRVRGYDCGYGGPFRPFSVVNFFQEAAGDSATMLGIGMGNMFADGHTWMISKIDIRVEALPKAGDEVVVRTWPAGTDKIFAMRCIEMIDATGARLMGALYAYLIVDRESRHPLRPERILDPRMKADLPLPYPDLKPGLHEVAGFDEGGFTDSFEIAASPRHIDNNGHVNNAFTINWLCDAVPLSGRGAGGIRRIKVDFNAEIKLGDLLQAKWKKSEWGADAAPSEVGFDYLSILERDGTIVGRSLTRWV